MAPEEIATAHIYAFETLLRYVENYRDTYASVEAAATLAILNEMIAERQRWLNSAR